MHNIKFIGLDHLRALAILLVFLYHYRMFQHPSWIDDIGWIGWSGVDLFFVISGFLIANQLFIEIREHHTIRLKTFFTKRFFRIMPPYIFTLFLYFCIPAFREREALPSFWKFISFTQNYGLDVINKGTFSHAWSLCIEEQFYLLLPLIILFFIKAKSIHYLKYGVLIVIIASILFRHFSWNEFIIPNLNSPNFWKVWYMKIYYPTYTRFDGLAIGVLIAWFFQFSVKFKNLIDKRGVFFLIAGLLSVSISLCFCRDQYSQGASIFGFTFVAVSYGILLLGAISSSTFLGSKNNFFTSKLALLSYSIYLSHKGVIHIVQMFLDRTIISVSGTLAFVICFSVCILVGVVYLYSIEKPSSYIKNKIIKTRSHEKN
ncbi:acyltransferase [Epilithonimonas sp. JDS]|uniref:acyltransferase family protein n=1 Tax=Epilithonimonas sp. JDS TaxID=2902797 RepID=UPI001E61FC0A|nr:acyltransferase [Epilithonimonas sp. JDS]MCD9855480.1 acyltransferase [Epilithonimonas sp. JDS]